jgi:hypothetical protein
MYKLFRDNFSGNEAIIDIEHNLYIPINPDNRDYQQYLKWLAEGNTPEPADE